MNFSIFCKKNGNTFQKQASSMAYPLLTAIFVFLLTWLILPGNSLFGSEGDWFSQHVAVAEQFRAAFLETGELLPDWLPLGGGSNSYDFSYYGLLRPDVLISFLLPGAPMSYIISAYAAVELIAGALLCYFWLKRNVDMPFFAFLGAVLYSCAGCFYHAHHQIMFVNYMPFLILALWGIEKLFQTGSIRMLVISLFLVCLHSYYFAPAVLVVCAFYFLQCLQSKKDQSDVCLGRIPLLCRFAASVGLALGMAAILLIPTGLALLSTSKDAGEPAVLEEIFSLQLDLKGLLYDPYGCGLTILCLYTLLLSIRRKNTRILAAVLLACVSFNACSYFLSGLLYVRYKVLIPLVPLLILLCVQTLQALASQKEEHSLLAGVLSLVPALFSDFPFAVLVDGLWIFLFFFLIQKEVKKRRGGTWALCLMLCIPSVCLFAFLGQEEEYISALDERQEILAPNISLSKKEARQACQGQEYRFECLTEPFANVNTRLLPRLGKTSMYSSVTDKNYADFYYNIMKNPIRIRNRVALMTDANPFFSYLMGIRYIQTERDHLPMGYAPIAKVSDGAVIAENPEALPIACTSTSLMSQKEFEKLAFPYTLEALTRCTVVPENGEPVGRTASENDMTAQRLMQDSKIRPLPIEDLLSASSREELSERGKKTSLCLPVSDDIDTKILILTANVASPKGKEVTVEINHIRNRLSGRNAPYPNRNSAFTWILSSNERISQLEILFSEGDYDLSGWKAWVMDTADWGNSSVRPLERSKEAMFGGQEEGEGSLVAHGEASLDRSGYLSTSLPFRKGYKAYINGKEAGIVRINHTFIGIPLDAGTYEVSIFYRPPGKTISCWISLAALALFVFWEALSVKGAASRRKAG